MELSQFRLVRQVLEAGSISKAALQLNKAHSIISRQISTLEKECGGRIFHRHGRGVRLTEFGESLLPKIDLILDTTQEISSQAQASGGAVSGRVRIGLTPSMSHAIAPPLFFGMREAYPDVTLCLSEADSADLEADMDDGKLDIAVFLRGGAYVGRQDCVLEDWDTYLMGLPGDPLLQQETIRFADLSELPLLLNPPPNFNRQVVEDRAVQMGVRFNVVAEVNGPEMLRQLVHAGAGYLVSSLGSETSAPANSIGKDVMEGTLQSARIIEPSLRRKLVLSTSPGSSRAVQVVSESLRDILKDWVSAEGAMTEGALPAELAASDA